MSKNTKDYETLTNCTVWAGQKHGMTNIVVAKRNLRTEARREEVLYDFLVPKVENMSDFHDIFLRAMKHRFHVFVGHYSFIASNRNPF